SGCRASGISCAGIHDARCVPHVRQWMDRLASVRDVLLVLNHPLWDTCEMGEARHRELLLSFLAWHKNYIHAFELNGLRTWDENLRVMELASHWNLPVISGGDRHGCEPNAVINLTRAKDFSTFVQEIRTEGRSVVVFLQQYRQPLAFRKIKTAWD